MPLYGFVATFLVHVWKIVSQHLFCFKSIVLPQLKILTSIGKYLCVSLSFRLCACPMFNEGFDEIGDLWNLSKKMLQMHLISLASIFDDCLP